MVKEKTEEEAWDEVISDLDIKEKEKWEKRTKGTRKRQWTLVGFFLTIILIGSVAYDLEINSDEILFLAVGLILLYVVLIYTYYVKSTWELRIEEKYGRSDKEENQKDS